MATRTDTPLPRLGTGPAAAGKLAALRAIHSGLATRDLGNHYRTTLANVENGPAPQEFKDAFFDTIADLTQILEH